MIRRKISVEKDGSNYMENKTAVLTLEDICESLSDEFQSTFTVRRRPESGKICLLNLLFEREVQEVVDLIKKRIPGSTVLYSRYEDNIGGKYLYIFELRED